jgi:hypothetical protein
MNHFKHTNPGPDTPVLADRTEHQHVAPEYILPETPEETGTPIGHALFHIPSCGMQTTLPQHTVTRGMTWPTT